MDWSHSGKLDLVSGDGKGGIWLFRNTGTRQNPVLAAGVKVEADGKPIAADPEFALSLIHVADWGGGGLRDLLVGRWTGLQFYKNIGTGSKPRFAAPTEIKCPVGEFPGHPTPCVADLDGDGKPGLILGGGEPPILFYRNIGTAQNPRLGPPQPLALQGEGFDEEFACAVSVTDWNGDGKPDLLVGAGGNVWLFLGCVREAAEPGRPHVYTGWPFDATEARRRQEETARALGVKTEHVVDLGGGAKLTLVLIPAGHFMMGSPRTEQERDEDEERKRATFGKPFWIGKYEVTQEQWEAVMGSNPSRFKGAKNPVETVSWNDIQGFLQKLNGGPGGGGFALPTEAQWEYACRAGTSTRFCSGDDYAVSGDCAWYDGNSQRKTHPVGQKRPNAWGVHDMHGNVWEWCSSPYSWKHTGNGYRGTYDGSELKGAEAGGDRRVLRGGSWNNDPRRCRSAYRHAEGPECRLEDFGFRVIRSVRTSE